MKTKSLRIKKVGLGYDVIVFAFLAIIIILMNDTFSMNPFLIVLLSLSANYRTRDYIITNIAFVLSSSLISLSYGYEITLICSLFFFFKTISNYFIKNTQIKMFFPYVIVSLMAFAFYLFKDLKFSPSLGLFLNLFISFLAFYSLHKMLNYLLKEEEWDGKDRVLLFCIVPYLFISLEIFFFMIIRTIQLILLKSSRFAEGLISVIVTCYLLFYIQNVSQLVILSLLIPYVCASFMSKSKPLIVYALLFLVTEIILKEQFYLSDTFYQGLAAILISFLIPEEMYNKLSVLFFKSNGKIEQEAVKEKEVINNVINYLDLVLDTRLQDTSTTLNKTTRKLKEDLCGKCEKRNLCTLENVLTKSVEEKINSTERKLVLERCEYPYRFFKRSAMMNGVYALETKRIKKALANQELYQRELQNIYIPLKLIDKIEEKCTPELVKKCLQDHNLKATDVKIYKDVVEVRYSKFLNSDIEESLMVIESALKRPLHFVKYGYSFASGSYIALYSSSRLYKVDVVSTSQSALHNVKSGDTCRIKEENDKLIVLLSDGMGHEFVSQSLSSYLVDTIYAYRQIDSSFLRQIETVNRLIYHKSTMEIYATLDYFELDLIHLNFTLFKAGSFPTYIYRNHALKESKKSFPPLGILSQIDAFAYEDVCQVGDIIVFLTDGFGNDVSETIEAVLESSSYLSSKEIAHNLKEALKKQEEVDDDKTLIVIKIEKSPEISVK